MPAKIGRAEQSTISEWVITQPAILGCTGLTVNCAAVLQLRVRDPGDYKGNLRRSTFNWYLWDWILKFMSSKYLVCSVGSIGSNLLEIWINDLRRIKALVTASFVLALHFSAIPGLEHRSLGVQTPARQLTRQLTTQHTHHENLPPLSRRWVLKSQILKWTFYWVSLFMSRF